MRHCPARPRCLWLRPSAVALRHSRHVRLPRRRAVPSDLCVQGKRKSRCGQLNAHSLPDSAEPPIRRHHVGGRYQVTFAAREFSVVDFKGFMALTIRINEIKRDRRLGGQQNFDASQGTSTAGFYDSVNHPKIGQQVVYRRT